MHMKISFILLLGFVIANLSGCATKNVDPYVLNADKDQGMVYIGYKQTPWGDGFNKAVGNWEKGVAEASRVCSNWGYSHAESLNKRIIKERDENNWIVSYMQCQCVVKKDN